jgi:hypothetical protein
MALVLRELHGMTGTRTYSIWTNIKSRCTNRRHPQYGDYGGRGITLCKRWFSFCNFLADVGVCPSSRHSLDRKNNNRGYSPSNCEWATPKQQSRNQRGQKRYFFQGRSLLLCEWEELTGIPLKRLWDRLSRDWSFERTITEPPRDTNYLTTEQKRERLHAYLSVYQGVKCGRIVKPRRCEECGKRKPLQAHHYAGYSREHRRDVNWLCTGCHARHLRKKAA